MAPTLPAFPETPAPLPRVRLELRQGGARPTVHEVADATFLVGGVPGCDLRLPGTNMPPVLCLINCQPDGVLLRKLAPVFPVLVNGRTVTATTLNDGDRVTLGGVDLFVSVEPGPVIAAPAGPTTDDLEAQRQVEEAARALEEERAAWERQRAEIERAWRQRVDAAAARAPNEFAVALADLQQREEAVRQAHALLSGQRDELEARAEQIATRERETAEVRRELTSLRQQVYERYRKRRDRLAGLQEAVRRAARKLQERKRSVDEMTRAAERVREEDFARHAELTACAEELARERDEFERQRQEFDARQSEFERGLTPRLAECETREHKLARDRDELEKSRAEHQSDLVRLDRLEALLEQRQQQLQARAVEVDRRSEQLQRDSRDLEDQATQLDDWHRQLGELAEKLQKQKAEQDASGTQVAQRTAALEAQQAMLASLRTRLERMREEVGRDEQALAARRAEQEAASEELKRKLAEANRARAELEQDRLFYEQERKRMEEREATLTTAVARLQEREAEVAAEQERLRLREAALATTTTQHAEQADLVRGRGEQLATLQKQLEAERQSLRERDAALAQSQKTLTALQEQLRRRSDDLAAKQRAMEEQAKRQADALAGLERQRAASEEARREAEDRLTILHAALDGRGEELEQRAADMVRREEELRRGKEQMQAEARLLQGARAAVAEEQTRWEAERGERSTSLERERGEAEAARAAAAELHRQLPALEERAREAMERLVRTRDQVREQLAEVSAYAAQGRADLEALQAALQAESDRVRRQELELHKARDEHRLAVAAFRQQLIEWQGQVTELKRSLEQGETRLGQRQAELEEQARRADAASRALAEEAERLQERQREVEVRHGEVHRHLEDMRQWYRTKLRELAGAEPAAEAPADGEQTPSILSLTEEVSAGDRQLGELLRSLELVDADVLARLLVEARRQRRSLRQLLLSGGYLTLYQVALIEAGNLDALALGPVRVIDRVRATPTESAYRVFDPRRGEELMLRHLAEAEMQSAVRPDEFRERFAAAARLRHPHLETTYEVLEVGGRPAVLQEWVRGLPSGEWPALAAVPGVWFRLVCQSALALQTIQQAGLAHGRLTAGSFMLTAEGVVKLCGLGEPDWLAAPESADDGEVAVPRESLDDLAALGHIAAAWAATAPLRKGAKSKSLPEPLQAVLRKLTAEDAEERYESAAALLEELDAAGADVTPNAAAWERLLKQVREQGEEPEADAA